MLKQLNAMRTKTAKDRGLDVVPAIIGEDFNGTRNDPYDGPGKAMVKYGLADSFTRALARNSTQALIDRLGVTVEGITVLHHDIFGSKGSSDHKEVVAITITLSNKKA